MTYTAWDGNQYEGEPPPGWYEGTDDRWWPEGHGPGPKAAATPPPFTPPAATPPPIAPPPGPAPAFGVPDPGPPPVGGPSASSGGGSKLPLVLGIGALALVALLGIGAFLVFRADDDGTDVAADATTEDEPADETSDDAATETTAAPAESTGDTAEAGSEEADIVSCTRSGPDEAIVELVNNSPETSTYFLTVGFFDDSGARLADEGSIVSYVRPGERVVESLYTFEEVGTVCEVIDVDRNAAVSDPGELAEVSACEITGEDSFGDVTARVTATNGTPETSDYSITVAFVDGTGTRKGTGFLFIESVRTDESAPGDVFTTVDVAPDLTCEVVAVDRTAS